MNHPSEECKGENKANKRLSIEAQLILMLFLYESVYSRAGLMLRTGLPLAVINSAIEELEYNGEVWETT